jgi:hypothetical protein
MSYSILRTENAPRNLIHYYVQIDENRVIYFKGTDSTTQAEIDKWADELLAEEKEVKEADEAKQKALDEALLPDEAKS